MRSLQMVWYAHFVIEDTSPDSFGLSITQSVGNSAYSGLAIDDVQTTPEPGTGVLCLAVIGLVIVTRAIRRPLGRLGRHIRSVSVFAGAPAFLAAIIAPSQVNAQTTTTPIQHVIVIFGENISFDHYLGAYPNAVNPPSQPRFTALPGAQPFMVLMQQRTRTTRAKLTQTFLLTTRT